MAPALVVTVAACQLGPVLGEVAANLRQVEAAVLVAVGAGAEVVVLPELVTTGYVFGSAQEARGLAEPVDGPSLQAITTLAAEHDLVIAGGFAELAAGDEVYNSSPAASSAKPPAMTRSCSAASVVLACSDGPSTGSARPRASCADPNR